MITTGVFFCGRDVDIEFTRERVEILLPFGFQWDWEIRIDHVWLYSGKRRRDILPWLRGQSNGEKKLAQWRQRLKTEDGL